MVKRRAIKIGFSLGLLVLVCTTLIYVFYGKDTDVFPSKDLTKHGGKNNQVECVKTGVIQYARYEEKGALWEPNNKFGLYIYPDDKRFFDIADELVNSNGGDWGYVLIPFNVRERDRSKWKSVFEKVADKNLIPIIQLWNVDPLDYRETTKETAEFLDSFVWPIKYRYVSVYNEPNDASFWFGKVDPGNYARVLDYTIKTFKDQNKDFFMINGAFNTSAATNHTSMDAFDFMKQMNTEVPGIFNKLDGWASHSYPQPEFSGNPHDQGRWSIRAYDSELYFLKKILGVDKYLPVFITETGWAHAEGESYDGRYKSVDVISDYFKQAYEEIWLKDDRVRAVTPFTVWYKPPSDHFAWVNRDKVPYKHYDVVKSLSKVKGQPPKLILENLDITSCD